MIVYAAIDLRGGRVVQLVGGRPENERISLPDPVGAALAWVSKGFPALHVIDLDAALGTGNNLDAVSAILAAVDVPVHVGGGVRDDATADALLAAGAARVIVGTRAVEDRMWITALAERLPGRGIVAADARDGIVLTRGWTMESALHADAFLRGLDDLQLAAVLVTDVGREGRMEGVDAAAFGGLVRATRHPLIAAGGIADADDLRALEAAGVAGAVVGMALYTHSLDGDAVAREFHT